MAVSDKRRMKSGLKVDLGLDTDNLVSNLSNGLRSLAVLDTNDLHPTVPSGFCSAPAANLP